MTSFNEFDVECSTKEKTRLKNPSISTNCSLLSASGLTRVCTLLLNSGLLDDLDAQIVTECSAAVSYRKSAISWNVPVFLAVGVFAICISLMEWSSLLIASTLWMVFCVLFIRCVDVLAVIFVRYFIRLAKRFDSAIQQIFSLIHMAEVTTFGLARKSYTKQRTCLWALRVDLLDTIRTVVDKERCLSESLCSDEEKDDLLYASMTTEMEELVQKGEVNEIFIKLPALKELWQLYFLLRSESIRLLLIHLAECSFYATFSLFFNWFRRTREMKAFTDKLNAVSGFMGQQRISNGDENQRRGLPPTMGAYAKARVQLQVAADLLSHKDMDEDVNDVASILKEVLKALDVRAQTAQPEGLKQPISVSECEDANRGNVEEKKVPISHNAPSIIDVDQMFEGVSHPEIGHSSCMSSFADEVSPEVGQTARSLVNELEDVLVGRKREMSKRERAALRRFYGKSTLPSVANPDLSTVSMATTSNSEVSTPKKRGPADTTSSSSTSSDSDPADWSSPSSTPDSGQMYQRSRAHHVDRLPESSESSTSDAAGMESVLTRHRPPSAWGKGLHEALLHRSALPQQHFQDSDSTDSDEE